MVFRWLARLFVFAEAIADQFNQRLVAGLFIAAIHFQFEFDPLAGSEHHNAHYALGIDPISVAPDKDFAFELASTVDQLGCRPRMQSELVYDGNVLFDHALPC